MADEKKGFMSRLFGRGKPKEQAAEERPAEEQAGPSETSPQVPEELSPDLGRGPEREVHSATAEEDTEAGQAAFLHEVPSEGGGLAGTAEKPAAEEPTPAPPQSETEAAPEPEAPKKRGFFSRLTSGLSRTSQRLTGGVAEIFTKKKLDEDTIEELEDLLLSADLGVAATDRVVTKLRKERVGQEVTDEEVREILAAVVAETLEPLEKEIVINPSHRPHVILVVGVNGAGKTTTIGKLAAKFAADGHSVLLAAGDTFRAAAVEQLKIWGERTGAPVLTKPHGADAAGLAFEAIETAKANGNDVVLIDTAGRLQNRSELMDELAKIVRVIRKLDPDAPHDTLLVLDATVGQNAIRQAEAFTETAGVTGLIMTKLDGTARGGILVALGDQFALPIHHIGIGEGVDDLRPFNARDFARAMTTDV